MYDIAQLVSACLAAMLVTALAIGWWARNRIAGVRAEERARHEHALRQVREEYAADLRELQQSLGSEVAAMRERMRNPLRHIVDTLIN